ncbi:MAG: CBS domain-containing protein, partial [Anaerolineae bacterium]|nr:CBS domain-containing protein [Anaerolineae bacterium]
MLVKERMTSPVLTITPDVPIQDALARMHLDKVRRYPVVDK